MRKLQTVAGVRRTWRPDRHISGRSPPPDGRSALISFFIFSGSVVLIIGPKPARKKDGTLQNEGAERKSALGSYRSGRTVVPGSLKGTRMYSDGSSCVPFLPSMISWTTLRASAMSSDILPVVSITKHTTEERAIPIILHQPAPRWDIDISRNTAHIRASYRRKSLSPAAARMSSRRSRLAYKAMLTA